MKWIKKGLIFRPNRRQSWSKSHAYLPTPLKLTENTVRVYYSSRDKNLVGRIGFVDILLNDDIKVLNIAKRPVLDVGGFGTFDESGVNPCCALQVDTYIYLYYFGWQKSLTGSYSLLCGLSISDDGGETFQRYSNVPILERTHNEPFLRSSVTVIRDGGIFRMWYVSGCGWTVFNNKPCPKYIIRYAESKDGIKWKSYHDRPVIDFANKNEFGFGRPWVIYENSIYKMWYSIRTYSKPYRLGYAESKDGLIWERMDANVGLNISSTGWDSEMVCFASVINIQNNKYMFYNGNKHGYDGFGCAINTGEN